MEVWTPPTRVTVEVDTREQYPLLFPDFLDWRPAPGWPPESIKVTKRDFKLDFGDYRLAEFPNECVVERKASIQELYANLVSADRLRAGRAFERFVAGCRTPYLLLDDSICDLLRANAYIGRAKVSSADMLDFLIRECHIRGIRLLCLGRCRSPAMRRELGSFIVRLMLRHGVQDQIPVVEKLKREPSRTE